MSHRFGRRLAFATVRFGHPSLDGRRGLSWTGLLLILFVGLAPFAVAQEKKANDSPPTDKTATDKTATDKTAVGKATADKPQAKPEGKSDASEKSAEFKYMRIGRGDGGTPATLETAVARFVTADRSKPPVIVDLIGVIHIGDRGYYDKLNESFTQYDALLYELVAPEGTKIPAGGRKDGGGHPVSSMQKGMKSMLDLEFQLDCIDYTKENFIHADMTPEEMAKSMSDKNESWMQMIFRMLGQGMAQQGKQNQKGGDLQLIVALFAKDRALRLKRIMAEQFEDMDSSMAALEGPDGSTLITERNKKALSVLERELKNGKKRIGIFYGAGHMADMEKRLVTEFGLKRTEEKWFPAWTMAAP